MLIVELCLFSHRKHFSEICAPTKRVGNLWKGSESQQSTFLAQKRHCWHAWTQKIVHIVRTGVLTPYFMRTLYSAYPSFSNFVQPPPSLLPPTPTPTALSVVLLFWLNEWLCHTWCAILLNDIMDVHMSSLGTLMQEGGWLVFYITRHQIYWGLTCKVIFSWYSDLISNTQTHTDTQYTQGPVDWDIK